MHQETSGTNVAVQVEWQPQIPWTIVFRDAGVGILLIGMDGRVLNANPAIIDFLGYDQAEIVSRRLADLTHPGDRAEDVRQMGRLSAGKIDTYRREKRYLRKDGRVRWGRVTVSLGRESDGGSFFIGMVEDIDRRRRAEHRLRTMLDSLPAMAAEIDPDGRYVDVNRAYEETFGIDRDKIIGRHIREVVGVEGYKHIETHILAALAGKPVTYEAALDLGLKGNRVMRVTYVPHRTEAGDPEGFYVFSMDVTDRVRAEQAQERAAARAEEHARTLDAVVAAVAADISMLDRDGRYLFASERSAEAAGRGNATELVGERFDAVGLPAPIVDTIEKTLSEAIRVAAPVSADCAVATADGSRHYEYTMVPVRNAEGAVGAAVATARDRTRRKQAENQIKASLAEKETLLKEVHHRVKNNMQVIIGLLNLQSRSIVYPEVRRSYEELSNRVRSLGLVHQMLCEGDSLARIDMADYIRRLSSHLIRLYATGEAPSVSFNLSSVGLDMDRAVPLGLVFNEILTNALIHAFPPDAGIRDGRLAISLDRSGGRALLKVADNGVGVSPDIDPTTSASLGLKLTQLLAGQVDGEVAFAPGEEEISRPGCTVTISWPDTDSR